MRRVDELLNAAAERSHHIVAASEMLANARELLFNDPNGAPIVELNDHAFRIREQVYLLAPQWEELQRECAVIRGERA